MKTLNMIAITENEQRQVGIPIELIGELNEQIKNYPNGMPMTVASGEQIIVLGLLLPTKKLAGSTIIFGSNGE
ncbi:hypothetical protein [Staphylococcus ureilyticus]|uniref:hypothetical protein n=1 Tax=Staphylococcus ureilyticus TaxID=94138 RepID=UPI0028FF5FA5|nr:hypothetical protein [Staphylococcus ureilyticus]MDU0461951.1 hypothetical protein [Staphylococcus ureilyticus]